MFPTKMKIGMTMGIIPWGWLPSPIGYVGLVVQMVGLGLIISCLVDQHRRGY